MNVEIGAGAAQFFFWNIFFIFSVLVLCSVHAACSQHRAVILTSVKKPKSTQQTVFRTLHFNNTIELEMSIIGIFIAWHRYRGLCCRHRHFFILYLNPLWYRSIPVPDWVPLFRYRTGSGIRIFVHSGTGLTGCQTVRHSGI